MQTDTALRQQRRSSEVDEVLHARSRRRFSGQVGRTHFKLAPGLLKGGDEEHRNASSSSLKPANGLHYNDAWQNWMTHGLRSAATSYDDAWHRWMGVKHDQTASSSSALSPAFEAVPREATRPIMSRLPLDSKSGEQDLIAADPTCSGNLDYISTTESKAGNLAVGGVHSDAQTSDSVTYTRARLPDLDEESLHLWQALHSLRNVSDDYADGYEASSSARRTKVQAPHPIADDMDAAQCPAFNPTTSTASDRALALVKRLFNWDELPALPLDDEYVWYGVAFRSKRRANSESLNLYEADRRSHEEAVQSGGLMMYWYGLPNAQTGHNLATCVWQNRQEALRASALPLHARAAAHALKAYESFELNRYALRKVKGETHLRLEEWNE